MSRAEHFEHKRIIHVPRRFVADEWGGTETVILEISRQQQWDGWKPEIFTSLALSNNRRDKIGGVPVRRFPYTYPFFGLSQDQKQAMDKKGGNLLSFSLFAALLRAPDVRLFHTHALKRLGGEVLTAAKMRRKACVVTLHGGVFDVPAAEQKTMMEPSAGKCEWGKPFGALFRSRRLLEDADHVICVGEEEFQKARQRVPHERISLLPNGVDLEKFARGDGTGFRARHQIPPDAFVVMNISRIDFQKNQLLLLEAFEKFHAVRPDARLVLIGPETQPDYAEKLRSFIRQNCLDGCVQLLPGLHNDDPELVNAYHACDSFVLPSIHEPFGIVVLEAWSCGKPVIVSAVGGLQGLVREGETGFFIDPSSPEAADRTAALLEKISRQPELARTLGRHGKKEVQSRYSWSIVAKKLETIYTEAEERLRNRAL